MTPLSASASLDQFYLEARCRLLDLAAILDRIDRGAGDTGPDVRRERIESALDALKVRGPGRAEKIQQIFSLAYDAAWPKPTPC